MIDYEICEGGVVTINNMNCENGDVGEVVQHIFYGCDVDLCTIYKYNYNYNLYHCVEYTDIKYKPDDICYLGVNISGYYDPNTFMKYLDCDAPYGEYWNYCGEWDDPDPLNLHKISRHTMAYVDYTPLEPGCFDFTVTLDDCAFCGGNSESATATVTDCIECWGPESIVGPPKMCAGDEKVFYIDPNKPNDREMDWVVVERCGKVKVDDPVVDARHSSKCTVKVQDDSGAGQFRLRAFDVDAPDCFLEVVVNVGCNSCASGMCSFGGGSANKKCQLTAQPRPEWCKKCPCDETSGDQVDPNRPTVITHGWLVESPENRGGAVSFSIGLGKTLSGESAGELQIVGSAPDIRLVTPEALNYIPARYGNEYWNAEVTVQGCNTYTDLKAIQIKDVANVIITNCSSNDPNYDIEFREYDSYDLGGQLLGGWRIRTHDADPNYSITSFNLVHYEISDSNLMTEDVIENYKYIYHASTDSWEVRELDSNNNTLASRHSVTTYDDPNGVLTTDYKEWRSGNLHAHSVTKYSWYESIREFLQTREEEYYSASSTDKLVTEWYYYDSGQLRAQLNPDGTWTHWAYNDGLNTQTVFEPYGDTEWDPNQVYLATDDSINVTASVTLSDPNGRTEMVTEYIAGTVIGQTKYTYDTDGNGSITGTHEYQCTQLTASASASVFGCSAYVENNVDYIYSENYERGEPTYSLASDGTMSKYEYDDSVNGIIYDGSSSYTYTSSIKQREVVVTAGYLNATNFTLVSGKSTRTKSYTDAKGRSAGMVRQVYITPNWVDIDWSVTEYYDTLGNKHSCTYRSDGTHTLTSGCCLFTTFEDSSGRTRTVERDQLGRMIEVVDLQLPTDPNDSRLAGQSEKRTVTQYLYTPSSRVEIISLYAGNPSNTLYSQELRAYDLSGRLIWSQSGGVATSYVYDIAPGGGQKVIEYLDHDPAQSDGPKTRISTYCRDGQLASLSGTAVLNEYHDYGLASELESDLGLATAVLAGQTYSRVITGDPNDPNLTRFTATTTDASGRTVESIRPGQSDGAHGIPIIITRNTYDTDGVNDRNRLKKTQTSVYPDSHYTIVQPTYIYDQYDELGNLTHSGLDLDPNGTLELSGLDRLAHSDFSYTTDPNGVWRENWSIVYPVANASTAHEVSRSRQKLNDPSYIQYSTTEDAYGRVTKQKSERIESGTEGVYYTLSTQQITTSSGSMKPHITVSYGGLTQYATTSSGVTTKYEYDDIGRQAAIIDGRGNRTETYYDSNGNVDYKIVQDGAGTSTIDYTYYTSGDNIGLLHYLTNIDGKKTYYDYNLRGDTIHVWGDVPYPTVMGYDLFGQRTSLTTYRDDPNGDTTTWKYDPITGLLKNKRYANGTGPDYAYYADGRMKTREWVRGIPGCTPQGRITTSYAYYGDDPNDVLSGQLKSITYNDGTPALSFAYDRIGQQIQVVQGTGDDRLQHDFKDTDDPADYVLDTEEIRVGANPNDPNAHQWTIHRPIDGFARPSGLDITWVPTSTNQYSAAYGYDPNTGRIVFVQGPGLPTDSGDGMLYSYLPNTNLIQRRILHDDDATPDPNLAITRYAYESTRPLLDKIENFWGATSGTFISSHDYTNDKLGKI